MQSDSEGWRVEVVAELQQENPGFSLVKNDPTEPGRVVELGARGGEGEDLIMRTLRLISFMSLYQRPACCIVVL